MRRRAIIVGFLVAGACSSKSDEPAPPPPPPAAPALAIFIDDQSVAQVDAKGLAAWPRLDSLVPVSARRLGTWQDISIKGADAKQLHKPSDTYRDLVPAVYAGDNGAAAFGMFDPVELANHGKPKVGAQGVSEIRITLAHGGGRGENESGDGGGSDPAKLSITITTPTGTSTLTGATLLAIAREPMPGDDSKDPRGWTLATVLHSAGIDKFQRLMLRDASGQALTLEQADFDAASIPFVKLNRSGQLRVTVYKKQGEGWQRGGDIRGLASIEIIK